MATKKKSTRSTPTIARSRNEALLGNMLGENNVILPPFSRIENLLKDLGDKISGLTEQAEPFVITLTATSATTGTSDKTADDIKEAYEDGRRILVVGEMGDVTVTFTNLNVSIQDGYIALGNVGISEPDGVLSDLILPWSTGEENQWIMYNYDIKRAPTVIEVYQNYETNPPIFYTNLAYSNLTEALHAGKRIVFHGNRFTLDGQSFIDFDVDLALHNSNDEFIFVVPMPATGLQIAFSLTGDVNDDTLVNYRIKEWQDATI